MRLEPVTLEGTHVRLEPLAPQHLDGIVRAGEDDAVWTWLPYRPTTRAEYEAWLNDALAAQAKDQQLPFATVDRATGDVVGSTRIFFFYPPDRRVEIGGTWLAPSAQRTPINTESKLLLLTHAFETLHCIAVEFRTSAMNLQSRAAIARLGAREDGILRNHQRTGEGLLRDTVVFSIIESEWPTIRRHLEFKLER